MRTQIVNAIDPSSGEVERAVLLKDYFGIGRDAIKFHWFNGPRYHSDEICWEIAPDDRSAYVAEMERERA